MPTEKPAPKARTARTARPRPRARAGTTDADIDLVRTTPTTPPEAAASQKADAGARAAGSDDENDDDIATELMPADSNAGPGGEGHPEVHAELVDRDEPGRLSPLARLDSPRREGGTARDPLTRFMAEVRRHPRLSEAEERDLGRAVRERGDAEAARRLVVHNLRLVVAIAHQYRRAWANILDLFQEGSVGLMEAIKRWEPLLGPRFGSYAVYWIRAYVLKFLMTNSRLIHVGNTRAGRKLFFRLERERQKLLAAGFEPTPKLLAAKLEVDEHDLDEVGRHLDSREVSFDPSGAGGDADEGYPLSEKIPFVQASPEDSAATSEMSGALHQVMDDFLTGLTDQRERAVWQDHLAAAEPAPLGEIGARFGVSKQRMGQIAESLKKRFRERIVARMGPDIRTDWLGGED